MAGRGRVHVPARDPGRRNRLHLDLISGTFEAETKRLLSLGTLRLRDLQADKSRWMTFTDVEGNEFDLMSG
jgi:glyoxalase superfamily protein